MSFNKLTLSVLYINRLMRLVIYKILFSTRTKRALEIQHRNLQKFNHNDGCILFNFCD